MIARVPALLVPPCLLRVLRGGWPYPCPSSSSCREQKQDAGSGEGFCEPAAGPTEMRCSLSSVPLPHPSLSFISSPSNAALTHSNSC